MSRYLLINEDAKRIGCTPRNLRMLIQRGRVSIRAVHGKVMISRWEIPGLVARYAKRKAVQP